MQVARSVLGRCKYLCLATADTDGRRPWASPLEFAIDYSLDIYWTSATDAVHSRNISQNSRIAIVIYDHNFIDGAAQAVYGQGTASALDEHNAMIGFDALFAARWPDPQDLRRMRDVRLPEYLGAYPRRLYRANIEDWSVLSPSKRTVDGLSLDNRRTLSLTPEALGSTSSPLR